MEINVMVSDDLPLSRDALTALLRQDDRIKVVGSTESMRQALELAEVHRPDVVVMSFEGKSNDTLAVAEKIASRPGCRSLLLATAFTRSVVRRAVTSRIDGMVMRSAPSRSFFDAIHRVHHGERVFDADLMVSALGGEGFPLTLREFSVLEHLAKGDTVVEIASGLCLSEGTVRNYISSIVAKLGARNRIDALRIAQDSHWI